MVRCLGLAETNKRKGKSPLLVQHFVPLQFESSQSIVGKLLLVFGPRHDHHQKQKWSQDTMWSIMFLVL